MEARYAAQAAAVMADSVSPNGNTFAQGIAATPDATKFVQESAEYPIAPTLDANEWNPAASSGMATSVGIAAYASIGMDATFDNVDNTGSVKNTPTVTGIVARVAERVATAVSFMPIDFGTNARLSVIFGAKAHIQSVAENDRRNEASEPTEGSKSAIAAATVKRIATASALNAGSASVAKLAIIAARKTGIPLPARIA